MNYKILTEHPDESLILKWNEFLISTTFPTCYISPNFFLDPFTSGNERFAILVFDQDEKISAALTGIDKGKEIVSGMPVRPQTAFRKDANQYEAAKCLFEGLKEKGGKDLNLINLYTWKSIEGFEDLGFQTETSKGNNLIIMLDLSKGSGEIFKGFSQTRRNELRKAMKQNLLEVKELETDEELRELYLVHIDWNKRKGNQPVSFERMQFAAFQKNFRKIFIAKHEGKVIAGSFYRFYKGGVVEYAANNSLLEFQKLRPNDLIAWRSIEWACESGFSAYSMGGSHLFLRRFGGFELATQRYALDSSFFKIHSLREKINKTGLKVYQNLPMTVRSKIKKVARKS
jgi:hypothetical protein